MNSRVKRRRESIEQNVGSSKPIPATPHSTVKSELLGQPKSTAMVEAERIKSNLPPEFHSFIKPLHRRNITGSGIHLRIPSDFANQHLSNEEKTMMRLKDENDEEFIFKYLPKLPGFGVSWKNFVDVHSLGENDVLVFLLINPRIFKVFISRAPRDVNASPTILVLDSSDSTSEQKEVFEQGGDNSDTHLSQDLQTYKAFQLKTHSLFSQPGIDEDTVKKYYNLCCCKKEILHDNIQPDFNIKLVVGIITQVVYIVDNLKAHSKVSTTRETLEKWQVALESFEKLGMKVGFVLKKVNDLIRISSDSEQTRYKDDLRKLEVKHVELTEACIKVSKDIEELKSKAETHKNKWLINEASCLEEEAELEFLNKLRAGQDIQTHIFTEPPMNCSFKEFLPWVRHVIKGLSTTTKREFVRKKFPGVPQNELLM